MANKRIDLEIGGENALRTLDALEARAQQLEQTLRSIVGMLGSSGSGASDQSQFFGTLQDLNATRGAISAARDSIASGGAISRDALMGGASAGAAAFAAPVRNRSVADPQAILSQVQGLPGMSGAALSAVVGSLANGSIPYAPGSASASAVVSQVVASVQAAQQGPANPFAVLPQSGPSTPIGGYGMGAPQGPYSTIGTPGAQLNAYRFQQAGQWDARDAAFMARLNQPTPGLAAMGQTAAGIAVGVGANYAGNILDYQTNQILNGGGSVIDRARMQFGAGGALIGAGLGAFGGPITMGIGAAVGGTLSGSVGAYLAAPLQSKVDSLAYQIPFAVADGYTQGRSGSTPGLDPRWRIGRFESLAHDLNTRAFGDSPFTVSAGQLAGAWGTVADGLSAGGINPLTKATSGYVYGASAEDIAAAERIARRGGGAGVSTQAAAAELLVKQFGMGHEQTGEMYTRRLGRLFGNSADGKNLEEASKSVASIFATLPETGGNPADVLRQFGPAKTSLFMRVQNEDLHSQVSLEELSRVSALTRGASRDASLGSLQARGSGAATVDALRREMAGYASLPGGDKSLVYAEAAAKERSAGRLAFEQADIGAYGIPMAHLQGERDRLEALPFAPGNRYANSLRTISLNQKELTRVRSYRDQRKKSGELSEEEELSLTQREEGLETGITYGISDLQNGFANKLPGLYAGRGRNFNQFTSLQGAQLALYNVRSPIRDFGAYNGGQLGDQNAWTYGLAGRNVRATGPHSRTQGLNASGGDNDGRLAAAIDRFADVVERLASGGNRISGGQRSGVAAGALGASIAQGAVGQGLNGKAN